MALKHRIRFLKDYFTFKKSGGRVDKVFPIYADYKEQAGSAVGHYFHQDLLVANYIFIANPIRHIDVGSRIDGFSAHVASFRSLEIIDVRELGNTGHENIRFRQMDLMSDEGIAPDLCDSLSCLHAIEHFGLGRYGDPINPNGHIIGFKNLVKMLKPGGTLYISFPIGSADLVFYNAHRIFRADSILNWPSASACELVSFSYVDDFGALHREVAIDTVHRDINYGCGIYTFKKN